MGGRGAFVNISTNDFSFVENGQTFYKIGEIDNIQIIMRKRPFSVKAPEYSHSENRIYAVVQNSELKHIAYYDDNHKQIKCVDFGHPHGINKAMPHVHYNLEHKKDELGISPSSQDIIIAKKIKNWLRK